MLDDVTSTYSDVTATSALRLTTLDGDNGDILIILPLYRVVELNIAHWTVHIADLFGELLRIF